MGKAKNILIALFTILFIYVSYSQNSPKLHEGMMAPNFTLQNHQGKIYKLSSFKGKSPVIIYFYPKAGTPGCTKQACGIRDDWNRFKEKNIIVLGISTDSKNDIKKFARDNKLNFPLLSDQNRIVTAKYGVLRDDGKAKRVTFIIDKRGMIVRILEVTDISKHSQEVFEIASQL